MALVHLEPPETFPEVLERLLRRRVPSYQAPLLLRCGAIRVQPRGQTTPLIQRDGNTILNKGDEIFVEKPLAASCHALLNKIPPYSYSDYAAVPGLGDLFTKQWNLMLQERPRTELQQEVRSLVGFVGSLREPEKPINDLILVSHASRQGVLKTAMYDKDRDTIPEIDYEDLAAAAAKGVLQLPDTVQDPRPRSTRGGVLPPAFHIRGCRIGQAVPFLDLLKKALGGHVTVSAPLHFNAAASTDRPFGYFEYMMYGFQINRPTPFKTHAEASQAFLAASKARSDFKDVNQREMPNKLWGAVIPTDPRKLNDDNQIAVKIFHPITRKSEQMEASWTVIEDAPWDNFPITGLDAPPRDKSQLRAAFGSALVEWGRQQRFPSGNPYDPKHPFPRWVRRGYSSMGEMLNGFDFGSPRWDAATKTLFVTPRRVLYIVKHPVTDASSQLYVNWFPTKATRAAAGVEQGPPRSGGSFLGLNVEDNRFFAMR